MDIRKLNIGEKPPMDLLLLADPSRRIVEEYVKRGECFVAESDKQIIGVYVLLPTRPDTVELVNIAVAEDQHSRGIGQLALYQKCGFRIIGVDIDFFIRHYPEEIFENGIQCRDMVRLSQDL